MAHGLLSDLPRRERATRSGEDMHGRRDVETGLSAFDVHGAHAHILTAARHP